MTAAPARTPSHQAYEAAALAVPAPFKRYAVRSEEARHAELARSPYGRVHLVRGVLHNASALAGLAALGLARMRLAAFSDIDYALVGLQELADASPGVADLVGLIAAALRGTGVLGDDEAAYRPRVAARIDFLGAQGAGFHNDVARHWTACLFWNLALAVDDVEFVMPHAGLRLPLQPGDLIVFDQTLAHGLCRPRDQGQAVAASFAAGAGARQVFLAGELALGDAEWAALGAPWLPLEAHADALELVAASFDERSGAVQRPHALAHCMSRDSVYAEGGRP
ncbi:conserved hypothetical protein [Rubrivivax sp. A210]|uniref:hypothetical protein n=1 Tax=Rubrivivax sp. A210 TaxID=2772301 RepID=UPI001918ACE1|nr:hypothetical protein [Rubrivivax sp. A210]CAD5374258.1 conserved hypothetical protein [Rubrivivax sp. A210]